MLIDVVERDEESVPTLAELLDTRAVDDAEVLVIAWQGESEGALGHLVD